jgi:hypothetical protein
MTKDETWFSRGKADADKGIPPSERISSIAIAIFSILMVLFFVNHQTRSTGFFTAAFGMLEQFLFYGYWFFGLLQPLWRESLVLDSCLASLMFLAALLLLSSVRLRFW